MDLKEPKRKKRVRVEVKSSLPLVFGRKGELTKFHANLTALGSCIADPSEMEIIFKMGYFGKGSLSKSHPLFGRIRYGAPPIIRERQWNCREKWISEVHKLSIENFFEDEKNGDLLKNDEKKEKIDQKKNSEKINLDSTDIKNNATILNRSVSSDIKTVEKLCDPNSKKNDILILENDKNNIKNNIKEGKQVDMDVDEVVLDSTEEEEDICEVSIDNYQSSLEKSLLLHKNEGLMSADEKYRDDSELQGKVLVLPDSDSDTEDYLINIKPKVKHENFPVRETLHLTYEETFFLMYGLGCLRIIDFDGKYLSIGETWDYFCKEHKFFIQKYVTYHYFRSKGWIVKPGLKYGGDYLLYKEGPPFYHSSYIVIIDVLDSVTLKRIESKSVRSMSWNKYHGLERLAGAVGKEILFAQVLWPSNVPLEATPLSPDVISQFTVRELLWRRWKLSQEISSANLEDDCHSYDEDDDFSM